MRASAESKVKGVKNSPERAKRPKKTSYYK